MLLLSKETLLAKSRGQAPKEAATSLLLLSLQNHLRQGLPYGDLVPSG